jgi:cytochrome c oxidase assembly factor CtaG
MSLISLLVAVLVFILLWYLIGMLPGEPKLTNILRIVLIVFACIWLLEAIGMFSSPSLRLR